MPSTLSLSSHPSSRSPRSGPSWRHPSALLLAITVLAAMLGFYLQVLHDAMTRAATAQAQMLQEVVTMPPDFLECDGPRAEARRNGCPPPLTRGLHTSERGFQAR